MARDITLIMVMQQTSLSVYMLYIKLITSISLNMVAIMFDLPWCTVELLSMEALTAWAA